MAGIPPNAPQNPYPHANDRPGITSRQWVGTLGEYFHDHPGLHHQNWNDQGQPANGDFQRIWNEIQDVKRLVTRVHPPHNPITPVRKELKDVVAKSGYLANAVCLGLGAINYKSATEYDREYIQQCGVFFAICHMIEEKQQMQPGTLPVIFQDPVIEIEDRIILDRIGRQTIVWPPAAEQVMTEQTFVYALHFPANRMFETFLRPDRQPELLFTNTFHQDLAAIGWVVAVNYLDKVYWTHDAALDDKSIEMYNTAIRFLETHEGIVYWGVYSNEPQLRLVLEDAFARSSFYVRRHGLIQTSSRHPVFG